MDLFKFREMRATRWLLWHSDFAKFDFRPELVIKYSDEAFCAPPLLRCLCSAALKRIHTATPDTTKLSCLCRVRFGGANWSADRQLKTVAGRKFEVRTRLEQSSNSHRQHARHDTDRTVLSRLAGGVDWAFNCRILCGRYAANVHTYHY